MLPSCFLMIVRLMFPFRSVAHEIRLLGCALDALSTWVHVIIVFVHSIHATSATITLWIILLKQEVVHHSIWWGRLRLDSWRQHTLQSLDLIWGHGLAFRTTQPRWELDVELDVQITIIVVAEGWHALAANNLDGA
jgi:hypothetical protein